MKKIISFSHISDQLSADEVEKLKGWYRFYHRKMTCYKWMYNKLRKLYIGLNVTSILLIVIGDILAPFTHFATLSVAGAGILLQTYITKSNISNKKEQCRFAYTSYQKILTQLRSYLQGLPYSETVFLTDVKVLDDIISDTCPYINGMSERYDNIYGIS